MRMLPVVMLLAGVLLLPFAPIAAQQKQSPERPRPPVAGQQKIAPEPETAPSETPPPYEPQVLKLAGILGSLAFLTDLCGAPSGIEGRDVWRTKAQALLNAEPMSELRRQRFAGAFNRGFDSYRLVYRSCTANARLSMDRLMSDGAVLTRDIAGRFGG